LILLYLFFVLVFLIDTGYSFLQYKSQPLEGDIAFNVIPVDDVKLVLESPYWNRRKIR